MEEEIEIHLKSADSADCASSLPEPFLWTDTDLVTLTHYLVVKPLTLRLSMDTPNKILLKESSDSRVR